MCIADSFDLLAEAYNVYLVTDCVASRKLSDKDAALIRARQEGAMITTSEAILFELLERAGSDMFKTISGLIK